MKIKILMFFILGVIILDGCKTKTDIITPDTELILVVTDEDDRLLDSADVYLFDSRNSYVYGASNNVSTGSVAKGITKKGVITFENLSSEKDYFVHISYRDSLSNLDTGFKIYNKLTKSSKTFAHITLRVASKQISFWTLEKDGVQLPLSIYINDEFAGVLDSARSGAPTLPSDEAVVSTPKIPGSYSYYAKSSNGCIWQGTVVVVDTGNTNFIQLQKCEAGTISFWSGFANNAKMPITIIMDRYDTIGIIDTPRNSIPSNCSEENTIAVARPAGNHTYHAISVDNEKLWADTLSVVNNACKIIKLEDFQ